MFKLCNKWRKIFIRIRKIKNVAINIAIYQIKKNKLHLIDSEVNVFGFKTLIPSMNEYGKFIKGNLSRKGRLNTTIQINHYWSKTYNEYKDKKILRGDAFFIDRKRGFEEFYNHELNNISSDYKIFRFLIKLKEKYYKL